MVRGFGAVLVAVSVLVGPALAGEVETQALSGPALEQSGALVVDIRESSEWRDTGVVPGALRVTYRTPEQFLAEIAPSLAEGQTIALICRSGRRSAAAAAALAPMTDHPIIDVAGGVSRLFQEGVTTQPCPDC